MTPLIFFDMDGVLCDFVGGSLRAHGKTLAHAECRWDFMTQVGFTGGGDERFWGPLANPGFWANLDPLPDGMTLFRRVEALTGGRVSILSSGLCPGSADGKREWLKQHLPGYERKAVFCTVKEQVAAPHKLLIDDHEPNVNAFRDHGGPAVLVPRPWNRRRGETCLAGGFDVGKLLAEIEAMTGVLGLARPVPAELGPDLGGEG